MSNHPFTVVEQLADVTIVHQARQGRIWGSRGRRVLVNDGGSEWLDFAKFPFHWKQDAISAVRPLARLTRADKCNVYCSVEGRILGVRGGVVFDMSPGSLQGITNIQGDSVLQGCICSDPEGWIYLGEYFRNPDRQPVRIHRFSPDLHHHEIAYEFPEGNIRHVHGVFADPRGTGDMWVTTGDFEGECFLYHTADRFRSVDRIGGGGQRWRAVQLHFTDDHISWLTDSHLEQNYACRIPRGSESLEVGQKIPCSTWYGAKTLDGLHFAFTTVEPGPGIHSNRSKILASQNAFDWLEVHSFKKDIWRPMSLFKFGVISCAEGPMSSDRVYLSGEGLVGFDGHSMIADLSGIGVES